jgi:hypothetical protein
MRETEPPEVPRSEGARRVPRERAAVRATVTQWKTQRLIGFEITEQTRKSVEAWNKACRTIVLE